MALKGEGAAGEDYERGAPRAASDDAMFVRFTRFYTGRHDPADALWWLGHPDEAGPTGKSSPRSGARGLRAAVYSRSAGDAERAAWSTALAALELDERAATSAFEDAGGAAADPTARSNPSASGVDGRARRSRSALVLAVAVVALGVALGAALVAGAGVGSHARAAVLPTTGPQSDGLASMAALGYAREEAARESEKRLFTVSDETTVATLFDEYPELETMKMTGAARVADLLATGSRAVRIDPLPHARRIAVFITCVEPAVATWSTEPGHRAVHGTTGQSCASAYSSSRWLPLGGARPTSIRITVPARVRYGVTVYERAGGG